MASVIKSIQQVSVTIAAGATSGTAAISSVTTANAIVVFQGQNNASSATTSWNLNGADVALTNATTVTATRNTSDASNAVTVHAAIVEFASGVNSIQTGTISLASVASNTATISAVGANAFVLHLGATTSDSTGALAKFLSTLTLTNSTTVTANVATAPVGTLVVRYMVADLDSTIVNTVQAVSHTDATAATSYTDTITSVTPGNTLLIWNGELGAAAAASPSSFVHTIQLTNGTTVTLTRAGTLTTSRTVKYTVVQFAAAALSGAVQRGTIAEVSQNSKTATISSVSTTLSFCNYCGFEGGSNGGPNTVFGTLALTNATTVTFSTNTLSSQTGSYEVIQFFVTVVTVDFPVSFELLARVNADSAAALELSRTITFDSAAPAELSAALRADFAAPLEALAGFRSDLAVPAELLAKIAADAPVSLELSAKVAFDMAITAELLATFRWDAAMPIESLRLMRADSPAALELLAGLAADGVAPIELSGSGVVFTGSLYPYIRRRARIGRA